MFHDYLVADNTCGRCKTTLVRVPQSVYAITELALDDAIVCVDCGAAASLPGMMTAGC